MNETVKNLTEEEIEKQYLDNKLKGIYQCIDCEKEFKTEFFLFLHEIWEVLKLCIEVVFLLLYGPIKVGRKVWNYHKENKTSTLKTILIILFMPILLPFYMLRNVKKYKNNIKIHDE